MNLVSPSQEFAKERFDEKDYEYIPDDCGKFGNFLKECDHKQQPPTTTVK